MNTWGIQTSVATFFGGGVGGKEPEGTYLWYFSTDSIYVIHFFFTPATI
jgi:hypothetical protein